MLATRQKINAINKVIREMLQDGVYPTLLEVFDRLTATRRNPWGQPQTTLRPALPNTPIGGDDGRDIERTFSDLREDLITWYNELVASADKSLADFWMFEGRRDILRRRILHLIQAADSQITSSARGGSTVLGDTFNAASLVDFTKTTAELNLDGGYITLPTSLNALVPISLAGAVIAEESYPTSKPHGRLTDALTDASNTGWYASLDGKTYTCKLKLPHSDVKVNSIYVNPMGPLSISISISNDSFNFEPVAVGTVRQERSWNFEPMLARAVKIEVTGGNVGIKQLKLLSVGFEERARLESVPLTALDPFGSPIPVHSVRLATEEECPAGTDIEYYVKPIYPTKGAQAWQRISDAPLWFDPTSPKTVVVSGAAMISQFKGEASDTDANQFYVCAIADNPVLETSRLTKGGDPDGGDLGQFYVEYTQHNWASDLDPNHSPVPTDWNTFGDTTKTYCRPLSLFGYTSEADPLQQEPDALMSYKNPMVEATTVTGGSESSRDWLVIGIKDADWLLAPKGNYRFTTYVYMPEDMVIMDKPCFLYNPLAKGGAGRPVIAPFRIYLNGDLVADVRNAWSGNMEGADLSSFNVSYSYKAGWNRFEVLIYSKGPESGDLAESEILADGGIGIYIAGNPYNLIRLAPGRRIQAHNTDETRVSEFALRHLVRPNDNTVWAWTDQAPKRNLILNYNPQESIYETYDGYNRPQSPVMTLFYYPQNVERPTGLKFAAEFSRDPGASGVPKLDLYKLIINQTGG